MFSLDLSFSSSFPREEGKINRGNLNLSCLRGVFMDTLRSCKDGAVPIMGSASLLHVNGHESLSSLHEGISMLLSRWTALQMAVQNEWGGRDSFKKSQLLASEIYSWFSQNKTSLDLEDLESLLHETLLLSFNTEIEDGSIEEVAEQLMALHEESLHGNLVSIGSSQHLLESPKDTSSKIRTGYSRLTSNTAINDKVSACR